MRIAIKTKDVSLTSAVRELVHKRLQHALGRWARRIDAMVVCFEDVNGPRGGLGVECRVRLFLRPRGAVSVSALAVSPTAALRVAAQRARRRLSSTVERRRVLRRRSHGVRPLVMLT